MHVRQSDTQRLHKLNMTWARGTPANAEEGQKTYQIRPTVVPHSGQSIAHKVGHCKFTEVLILKS
jgi:hypothetical protein